MTQPSARHGAPRQNNEIDKHTVGDAIESAQDTVKDAARGLKREVSRRIGRIEPDYLWLGGAFVLGCVVGLAASNAPAAFGRRGYGERLIDEGGRLQRRLSKRAADMQLQKKLTRLIDRLG
jgi:hypothetical protein